ncbi:MAG TPA: hypothetical protein VK978_05220 [Candidatus Saccharimonadales bacterium]|nr:hypothetical protein [Candidatus Saccharimonadales bacterium]
MEQASVFFVKVEGEPQIGKFYPAAQLPENVVDSQICFIKDAVRAYEAMVAERQGR